MRPVALVVACVALVISCKRDVSGGGLRPVDTGASAPAARSEGCGKPVTNPSGETLTTASGRTLHVWAPRGYDPAHPYPVVLAFHGIGSTGRQFQSWFKMEDFVRGEAIVAYPDAQGHWDLDGNKDLELFDAAVDRLAQGYCVDRGRVLAFGFSFGAKLAHHIGCKRSDKVKAIAAGDGSWHPEEGCGRSVPVLVTHRTRDPDELIAWGKDAVRRWSEIDGCSRTLDVVDESHGCKTYLGCTPANAVTFCEDKDDNPSWPPMWHHTIREEYRALTWEWFKGVR